MEMQSTYENKFDFKLLQFWQYVLKPKPQMQVD